jgi:predicted negative regulator of RcsB-dependent stress response
MNRQTMKFGAILCLVAMVSFSIWPVWKRLSVRDASIAMQQRTRAVVASKPELELAWKIAMLDGVMEWNEAKEILEAAGEKVDPQP